MSGEVSYRTHILIGVRPNGVMTVIADWCTCLDRTKSKRKSTGPETAMRHSRSARRPQSCRRTETAVREDEDGIGPLDQAGGEEGLRLQSKATVVPLWSLSLFRGQFPPLSEKKYSSRCPSAFCGCRGLPFRRPRSSGKELLRCLLVAPLHLPHARNVVGVLVPVPK